MRSKTKTPEKKTVRSLLTATRQEFLEGIRRAALIRDFATL